MVQFSWEIASESGVCRKAQKGVYNHVIDVIEYGDYNDYKPSRKSIIIDLQSDNR